MRRYVSWVLLGLGALFLTLSVPAGYVNRTVLDTPTFADRVDELRMRDDVSDLLGREIGAQLIRQSPDLIAIAPLVDQVSIGVMRSDALSGPVKIATSQFHRALTTENSDQLVLRLADVGAVVASAIGAIAPDRAAQGSNIGITLANIGNQNFAADIIRFVDFVDTLAWLLPLLAVVFLVAAVLVHPDRWAAVRRVGWAVLASAAVLALIIVLGGLVVRAADSGSRTAVLLDAFWDVFVRPIWFGLALVAAFGAIIVVIGTGRAAQVAAWDVAALTGRLRKTPTTTAGTVARAVGLLAAGVAFLVEPAGMVTVLAFVVGVLLLLTGIATLAQFAPQPTPAEDAEREAAERAGWSTLAVVGLAGAVALALFTLWAGRPPANDVAGAVGGAVAGTGEVCNGHAELCDRRFDEVSYVATHNSMSVAGKRGWFLAEQGLDIVPQLDFGTRALLIDVWYGVDAGGGRTRTAARSYEEALAVANEELGPEIVNSALRVMDALAPGEPGGEEALYMCHGLCETGSTPLDTTLADIRSWLATNPDEVLTIFIEDHVDADDIAAEVIGAGLEDYLFTPVEGEPFPTLGDMIRSGRRLVVMLESGDGRPEFPWLVNGFDFVQETPFTFPTVESFSCEPNRGVPDAPLFQINHWLSGFSELVSSARTVNAADVLGPRAVACAEERGLQPTFVAVNFADIGDVVAVVDELNGVG